MKLAIAIVALAVALCWRQVIHDHYRMIEAEERQERLLLAVKHHANSSADERVCDYLRFIWTVGEIRGFQKEDDWHRLIYWTMSITNGMPLAERRLRIRKGLGEVAE